MGPCRFCASMNCRSLFQVVGLLAILAVGFLACSQDPEVKKQKYFLAVSRLEPYKRVDLVVQAFTQLNLPLIIVGKGTERGRLQKIANENTVFVSDLSDQELAGLYSNARALIMPQEEEFGYVSLEAQFFDCPVISYAKGGASETIIPNKTGIFFNQQTERSLTDAVARFIKIEYNLRKSTKEQAKGNLERFSSQIFIDMFKDFVAEKLT